MNRKNWRNQEFAFFSHKDCEFFPCHSKVAPADFNCLFCYCPLYLLEERCGGSFAYLKNGVKDCSNCSWPHLRGNYGLLREKLARLKNAAGSEALKTPRPGGIEEKEA